jgi:SAM-dependent methyltransferase
VSTASRFDERYYARFYSGADRAHSYREVAALAAGVCGMAEWLGLDLRAVLDVGAGPGFFGRWLRRHRPAVRYRSIDVSPYACARYGHERRDITTWCARERFDLVVCHGVLQYLDAPGAGRAIEHLGAMCRGLLYLEVVAREDLAVVDPSGTDLDVHARPGAWYRARLDRHFVQVGAGLWASRRSGLAFYELEACARPRRRGRGAR